MRTYELRAMSVGEILDGAVSLYRTSFTTLVSIAIVCLGIPTVLRVYVALSGEAVSVLAFLALLLWSFGGLVSSAATLWVISETYLGRQASAGEALRFAFSKIVTLFLAGLAVAIIVMFGMILLLIPGIIAACGYALVSQVVVLEGASADVALKRSWQLTKGFKWKVLGLGLVSFLIILLPAMALSMLTGVLPGGDSTASVAGDFVSLVITPLFTCAFTLLYYDLRVRKEAFDLEMLSQQLTGSWQAAT
jgi:uncharacterized membrane protein